MKKQVASILFEEYLPTGEVDIGSKRYDQDWNIILPALGFDRDEYTYTTEFMQDRPSKYEDVESLITVNILNIYEKEQER